MEDKERKAYEELLRQQEVKQDKVPFKERIKEDLNIFGVLVMGVLYCLAPIAEAIANSQ